MRYVKGFLIIVSVASALSGCATVDDVLFVTKTSVGFELDSKPATANISYDRIEGYIGPRYDNGAMPPVVASIQTDGGILNPQVKQVYATGAAATNLVVGSGQPAKAPTDLSGSKKLVFPLKPHCAPSEPPTQPTTTTCTSRATSRSAPTGLTPDPRRVVIVPKAPGSPD